MYFKLMTPGMSITVFTANKHREDTDNSGERM